MIMKIGVGRIFSNSTSGPRGTAGDVFGSCFFFCHGGPHVPTTARCGSHRCGCRHVSVRALRFFADFLTRLDNFIAELSTVANAMAIRYRSRRGRGTSRRKRLRHAASGNTSFCILIDSCGILPRRRLTRCRGSRRATSTRRAVFPLQGAIETAAFQ